MSIYSIHWDHGRLTGVARTPKVRDYAALFVKFAGKFKIWNFFEGYESKQIELPIRYARTKAKYLVLPETHPADIFKVAKDCNLSFYLTTKEILKISG